jgi:hypothetical protein
MPLRTETVAPSRLAVSVGASRDLGALRELHVMTALAISLGCMTYGSMPSPGLCRIAFKYIGWRGSDRFLVRHN